MSIIVIIIFFNKKDIFLTKELSKKNYIISGKIQEVVDGDSLEIKNYKIRLASIDAPEYKQLCFDQNKKQYKCGIRALRFLKTITHNKKVFCKIIKKDYYNRYLSKCFIEKNIDINSLMIEYGWAIRYNRKSAEYLKEENSAKQQKLGVWQGKFVTPKYWRRKNKRKTKLDKKK